MAKDKLINPASLNVYNICPECKNPITIYQREANIFSIAQDGTPVSTDGSDNKTYGICTKCGNKMDFMLNCGKFLPNISHNKYINESIDTNKNNISDSNIRNNYSNPFELKGDSSND